MIFKISWTRFHNKLDQRFAPVWVSRPIREQFLASEYEVGFAKQNSLEFHKQIFVKFSKVFEVFEIVLKSLYDRL